MSQTALLWLAIVGVGLTGVVTRLSFFVFGHRVVLPPVVERALRHAPAAALAAIVVPTLVIQGDRVDLSSGNHHWIAGLAAALVMWRTRGMLWAMAAGLAVFTVLRLYA